MPRSGPRAVRMHSDEFKLTAIRLSQRPGILEKTGRQSPPHHGSFTLEPRLLLTSCLRAASGVTHECQPM